MSNNGQLALRSNHRRVLFQIITNFLLGDETINCFVAKILDKFPSRVDKDRDSRKATAFLIQSGKAESSSVLFVSFASYYFSRFGK